tara:strand:- start:1954 stop:2544 length:591 start_codon:yes stop_codon:yes gene_type:complete
MAVQTINTDIAAEVDIVARRNDTFAFSFSVDSPTDASAGLALNGAQTGSSVAPEYQAKMSIVDASTGDVRLSLYTSYYQNTAGNVTHQAAGSGNTAPLALPPTATTAGHYSGISNPNGQVLTGGAIDFKLNTAVKGTLANISVPYNYMVFEPGEYLYDLQIRTQTTSGTDAAALLTIKYTTWMFGKFTLKADITSV